MKISDFGLITVGAGILSKLRIVKAVPISGEKNGKQFFNKIDTQRHGLLEEGNAGENSRKNLS